MNTIYHLGIQIYSWAWNDFLLELEDAINCWKQTYAVTPNPEIMLAQSKDDKLRNVLLKSNWNLPDGIWLIIWSFIEFVLKKWVKNAQWRITNRIAWSDIMFNICSLSASKWYRIFLLWWGKWIPERTKEKLEKQFPNIKIVWTSMWFHKTNSVETFNLIYKTKPNIIFLALWCPRQEYWIADNLSKFPFINFAIWIWWAFDFVVWKQIRAPKFIRIIWLEWLWRLILEPKRIGRIFNAIFWYLWLVIRRCN